MAQQGLSVYRQLLRSAIHAFREDVLMLTAARQEIRSKLEAARQVTDSAQLEQMLAEGREVAEFMRTSIVQGIANERGNIEMTIEEQHTGGVAEAIVPGMTIPRERRKKKTDDDGGGK